MNGAHALLDTLVGGGVDVCFANPGTSEMHFVAALDGVPAMRGVLTLFEGVATGAADGYARIAGKPASVLLHLGPGLGNGLANLHNARRAQVPMLVIVGDHATYHKQYDAPLESDIDSVADTVSGFVRRSTSPAGVGSDAAEAITVAATNRCVSTLILPADVSWLDGAKPVSVQHDRTDLEVGDLDAAEAALTSGERTVILVGGDGCYDGGLASAARIAVATGASVLCETFPTRLRRGAGVAAAERLMYFAEGAEVQLAGARHLILAGALSPVSFFAYPERPSDLVPDGCTVHRLAGPMGAIETLAALAQRVAPGVEAPLAQPGRPDLPTGALNAASAMAVIGRLLPEQAIIVDEANTSGTELPRATAGAPAHDVLTLTGGAIGFGLPTALGAAVAAPGRPVLCLESDGSAMYTISALWSHARENLDITTVIFNNGAYDILRIELGRVNVGAPPGPAASKLLGLGSPSLDFVKIAEGMGVPARRTTTVEEFADALRAAFGEPGPHVIEAMVGSILG
ncbi:MAG: acetolactate synthase large subunit [Mycobacterium sp.]